MSFEVAPAGAGRVAVRGALTFSTVSESASKATAPWASAGGSEVEVDLQGVDRVDSAGLALLVGWLASAREQGVTLRYTGIPERLLAIARISEVDDLLQGKSAA
ncbi:MAG: STAS domain-containing protein [Steroidobacteraceae bacterium]